MNAIFCEKVQALEHFAIQLRDAPEPANPDSDVSVDIRAIGINPGKILFRRVHSADPGESALLHRESAGVLIDSGSPGEGFKTGDRVEWEPSSASRRPIGSGAYRSQATRL